MIVVNADKQTRLGEAIEVPETVVQRVKGLLGRDCLADGQGLLFKRCSSLHTFFMQFPIDIIYADKQGKVLKVASGIRPFKLVTAPFRSHFAIELPEGAIQTFNTKVGDHLIFDEEWGEEPVV